MCFLFPTNALSIRFSCVEKISVTLLEREMAIDATCTHMIGLHSKRKKKKPNREMAMLIKAVIQTHAMKRAEIQLVINSRKDYQDRLTLSIQTREEGQDGQSNKATCPKEYQLINW